MLATRGMGSYHGQNSGLPFGYNESIEGVAFPPDYRPRGPPPAPQGKPLLNLSDQEELEGFFAGFESNLTSNDLPTSGPGVSPGDLTANNDPAFAPQYFITSHTHMQGQPPFVDPNALEGGGSMLNNNHEVGNVPMAADSSAFYHLVQHNIQPPPLSNYQHQTDNGQHFLDPLSTSINNNNNNNYHPVSWSHGLPSNSNDSSSASRPLVRFGTDSHFQPTGYVPPLGTTDTAEQNELQRLEWLEGDAQSSAANTRPNTQPNTEPSSPIWTRKRGEEDLIASSKDHPACVEHNMEPVQDEQESDEPPSQTRKRRKVTQRTRSSDHLTPARPSSTTLTTVTAKPGNRSKRKPGQIQTPTPTQPSFPPDLSPSTSNNTASFPTPKTAAHRHHNNSSSSSSSNNHHQQHDNGGGSGGIRIPLSSDQKRLNHTNSEQRRRDQAQRAFARLFDLVPELESEGKLSQMKKLERVVRKVHELEEGNQILRRRIERLECGEGEAEEEEEEDRGG